MDPAQQFHLLNNPNLREPEMKQREGPEIRVVNLKHGLLKFPTILVDRSTWLGNKYRLKVDGNRTQVIELYKHWFEGMMISNKEFRDKFYALAHQYRRYDIIQLACHCAPKMCHAEIIKQALEEIYRG